MESDDIINIEKACSHIGVKPKHLPRILTHKKAMPMIRGIGFEEQVHDWMVNHGIRCFRLGGDDADLQCGDLIIEDKLAARGKITFLKRTSEWRLLVKCMLSRSKQTAAIATLATDLRLPFETCKHHHDSYYYTDFDLVVCNLSNVFWRPKVDAFSPTKEQWDFLHCLGICSQEQANELWVYAKTTDVASMPNNSVHCGKKNCPGGCGFIPHHPEIFFKVGSSRPELPWKQIEDIIKEEGITTL